MHGKYWFWVPLLLGLCMLKPCLKSIRRELELTKVKAQVHIHIDLYGRCIYTHYMELHPAINSIVWVITGDRA
jgi:hypothetical protein